LMLALVDLPDFGTPLNRIAGSTEKMAGLKPGEGFVDVPSDPMLAAQSVEEAAAAPDADARQAAARAALPAKPEIVPTRQKELGHA